MDGGLVDDPFLPEEPLDLLKKGAWNKVSYFPLINICTSEPRIKKSLFSWMEGFCQVVKNHIFLL